MKFKYSLIAILLLTSPPALVAADWKPVPGHIMTEWADKVVWMVRKLDLPAEKLKRPVLRATYSSRATVYINGVKALELKRGYMMNYVDIPLSTEAAALLKAGENIIAIHAEKTPGEKPDNQFIDVGLGEETISW